MADRQKKAVPAYMKIAGILRRQIIHGELNPGDILPSENSLCETYGVSRDTARKGLLKLENDGLIFSRPKIGYFVNAPRHGDFTMTFDEQIPGCTTRYRDVHGVLPDARVQTALGIPPARKVIEFTQITETASNEPVAYDIKYIPYERAYPSVESELRFAVFPDITFPKVAPHDYYTELAIRAVPATEELAEILECSPDSPLLLVERVFIQHDGSRIGYALRFIRQSYGVICGVSGYVQVDAPQQETEDWQTERVYEN